ncbi:MAG: phosphonate ABC transporter, permease protein PhnE [Burkholderiales bacterium]|nr:phosphonate ABC transporter, permease protein PhnE [Burkholderiales bacterium]
MKINSPDHDMPVAPPSWSVVGVLTLLSLFALITASFLSLDLPWADIISRDALRSLLEFLQGFTPPDMRPAYLLKVLNAGLETLAMSALGTAIAAVFGLLLALPASGRSGALAKVATRGLLNLMRAIPELVWASMMLIAAGLGPFAGTVALAAHTTGVLGRLFAESFENLAPEVEQSLRINGASALQRFCYASLPQALPQLLSYSLYRWENNIRAAAIMGVVGAGGLGQMLKYHLSLFHMPSAATVIIAMLILVAGVDAMSFYLRRWVMR